MPVRNFEPINPSTDVTTTKTLLHEVIPVTGTIVSGTYGTFPNENNIKNYTHGQFQSVYDYPFLSSSANHIFDLSIGYASDSHLSSSSATQNAKKINMYNQFAQVLLGFTGSDNQIRKFESDLRLDGTGSMNEVFFISLSRLLTKDEIKKGTFRITLGSGSWADPFAAAGSFTLGDYTSKIDGTGVTNADGGDFGVLYDSTTASVGDGGYGAIFYQAGIVVLTSSLFNTGDYAGQFNQEGGHPAYHVDDSFHSASITGSVDALRHRVKNIEFNNTTQINSTIYFCRAPTSKFNYSSNPTYLTGSKIRIKNIASDNPVSYITTVGLYSPNNVLLATAKLSEPLKKSVDNELTIRVRLDY
ncbi:MAG: hypothetical protein CML45_05665 [Rhodobacteraceae bacterium]|nr:hypothetical protein [Paracoccaceae bacterium]